MTAQLPSRTRASTRRNPGLCTPASAAAAAVVLALQGCGGGGAPGTADAAPATAVAGVVLEAGSTPTPDAAPGLCTKDGGGESARPTVPALGRGTPEPDAHLIGMWSPIEPFSLIPLHSALLPDGRVMAYGTNKDGKQTGRFVYEVWSPYEGMGEHAHLSLPNTTETDLFCSAQVLLPQSGKLLLTGGDNFVNGRSQNTGNNRSNTFEPDGNRLVPGGNMSLPRWYGTPTMMPSGEVLIAGGLNGEAYPEIRQLDGTFRPLTEAKTGVLDYWYPRNQLARDGRVFGFDSKRVMYYIEPEGSGRIVAAGLLDMDPATPEGDVAGGYTSSAAMYAPGKMLVAGGEHRRAVTIDINGPLPRLQPTGSISSLRHHATLTVLPTGKVMLTGGSAVVNELVGVTTYPETWDPETGVWSRGPAGQLPRLYHSVALLLPDGSVMVGGGGAPGPANNTNAEIFYPPYLFEEGGKWATRPEIVSAPVVADPGAAMSVEVASSRPIGRLTLIKHGSITHALNHEQRFIELPFTREGNQLRTTLPRNAAELPPGFWMLFAIDDRGVPSIAVTMRVNVDPAPVLHQAWSSYAGGHATQLRVGGRIAELGCQQGEVLAGVSGGTELIWTGQTVVGRLSPLCVATGADGRWSGAPQARGAMGDAVRGGTFARTCAAGGAVSAVRAHTNANGHVAGLEVSCRRLGDRGLFVDEPSSLDPVGLVVGMAASPPVSCRGDLATRGLYGLAGYIVNAVGLQCDTRGVPPPTPVAEAVSVKASTPYKAVAPVRPVTPPVVPPAVPGDTPAGRDVTVPPPPTC